MSTTAETFARRVREERERAGLSQAAFAALVAEQLGSAFYSTAMTKIEARDREVKLEEAVAMAEVLDVPLGTLTSEHGATEVRLGELRHEMESQENRAKAAEAEFQQAQSAMAHIQQEIERLEASLDD